MKMTMIHYLVRSARRQLHTIVSRETIKPSSPTPSHLKTYNLTVFDQFISRVFMPVVTFYPNTGVYRSSHLKTLNLKNSLSHTLTKYYPFAGRYDKVAPAYVDCNDNGAVFYEASMDSTLSGFLQSSQHEDLDQFIPPNLNYNSDCEDHDLQSDRVVPLMVQVNHFECGGVAVGVSLAHKLADGASLAHFLSDWAKMTRFCSSDQKHELPVDPEFISFRYNKINSMGLSLGRSKDCVTWSFMFPNSKINDLRLKLKAKTAESTQAISNSTRVEVLSWLLYKCAMGVATKTNTGSFKPTSVYHLTNIRGKMVERLPEKSIGNFFMMMEISTKNESEMNPESFISELKRQKLLFKGIRNIEIALDILSKTGVEEQHEDFGSGYLFSSMCGYPLYEIDFGWGKPLKVTIPGFSWKNCFVLMDAPNRDGIEALVTLEKQDMQIFRSDPELLAFT